MRLINDAMIPLSEQAEIDVGLNDRARRLAEVPPPTVVNAELGVAQSLGVNSLVFEMQQLQRDVLAAFALAGTSRRRGYDMRSSRLQWKKRPEVTATTTNASDGSQRAAWHGDFIDRLYS